MCRKFPAKVVIDVAVCARTPLISFDYADRSCF